jgi:hypothetical protein
MLISLDLSLSGRERTGVDEIDDAGGPARLSCKGSILLAPPTAVHLLEPSLLDVCAQSYRLVLKDAGVEGRAASASITSSLAIAGR